MTENTKELKEVVRYLLKVGYNHGRTQFQDGVPYQDDFGRTFDLDTLREPERTTLRAHLEAAPVLDELIESVLAWVKEQNKKISALKIDAARSGKLDNVHGFNEAHIKAGKISNTVKDVTGLWPIEAANALQKLIEEKK